MTKTMIPAKVIEDAVHLACRAPSYHNTQPWRWIVDKGELHLYVDADRVVATDHGGRQALISCGAALDHLTVAMAAAGHEAHVDYYPNPNDNKHVASISFSPMSFVTDGHRRRADAILSRRTDRLPFGPPNAWDDFERLMRGAVYADVSAVDVISDSDRPGWPRRPGSPRRCGSTIRTTTPKCSGGRRRTRSVMAFRTARWSPPPRVTGSTWDAASP